MTTKPEIPFDVEDCELPSGWIRIDGKVYVPEKEASQLAANQCLHGIHGDDWGNSYCPEIERLKALKLFAFQPDGHGQLSFFVMAADVTQASKAVKQHIDKKYKEDDYYVQGWGTAYYNCTILPVNTVIENDNS